MEEYYFSNLHEKESLKTQHWQLVQDTWNPVILASSVLQNNWQKLYDYFSAFQLTLHHHDQLVAYAVTLPFFWSEPLTALPEEGWDWLLQEGVSNFENGVSPNYLGGLLIGVAPEYRGKQLSKMMIREAKALCKSKSFEALVIPIRPTLKDQHPTTPMESYMEWKKDDKIFDPWIRTHVNSGATIVKVCNRSMTIEGNIAEWEEWTKQKIVHSSTVVIDGLLSPVQFSVEHDNGIYIEPNIWIAY